MKILSLQLEDFRCFETFAIEFDKSHTLHAIIAENMVGKSAILAALKLAANTYTSGLKNERQFHLNDHRVVGVNPMADIMPTVKITVTALFDERISTETAIWEKYKTQPKGAKTKVKIIAGEDPRQLSKKVNRWVAEGKSIQPLFSYIGTEYIHVESSDTVDWEVNGKSIDGYKDCFEDKSIKKFLFNWLSKIDNLLSEINRKPMLAELYGSTPRQAMDVFQLAVVSILPDISAIEWHYEAKQPVVKFNTGAIRLFDMLSDGYRYLILLAGELATRAFILNKHLGKNVLQQISGVVLIDEFGIHLHPALQNDALIRLQSTFPRIQFIISTHAPLLLNGLKKEQVHILSINNAGQRTIAHPDEDIIGLGATDILVKVFGLDSTMDKQYRAWEAEYTNLFARKNQQELSTNETQRFEELSARLAHVRLDPLLYADLREEDTLTQLVKSKIVARMAKTQALPITTTESQAFDEMLDSILDEIFWDKSS